MKKFLALILVLTFVISATGMVFADSDNHYVNVSITPYSTTDSRIVVEQGQTQLLTATAALGNAEYTFVEDSWEGAVRYSGPTLGDKAGNTFVSTALFKASTLGQQTVTYSITLWRPAGGSDGTQYEDDDKAYIQVVEEVTMDIFVSPMAAPAIANQILQFNNIKPNQIIGQGKNKTQLNLISEVARHMGPQTDFEGEPKAIMVDGTEVSNGYYWDEVLDFLNKQEFDLKMPTDEWLQEKGLGVLYYY